MHCLGIETSCDETAAAVVKDGREILSNVVASQLDLHAEYGGVVPELACRKHIQVVDRIVERALRESGVALEQIELVSVVQGPGLIGALLIGVNFAKGLAFGRGLPLVPVNHVEAHVYACAMSNPEMEFPAIGLVASGGHTSLFMMEGLGKYRKLGETTDDAVGESFDKVASLLGLPYMGGPQVEKLALQGDPNAFPFPRGMSKKKNYNFSYSGLKTAVLYHVRGFRKSHTAGSQSPKPRFQKPSPSPADPAAKKVVQGGQNETDASTLWRRLSDRERADVAASFQEAALDILVEKSLRAASEFGARSIAVGGGVAANQRLRDLFRTGAETLGVPVYFPTRELCTDNAGMVAGLGYWLYKTDSSSATYDFDAIANMDFFR